jgi:hypothetical protein
MRTHFTLAQNCPILFNVGAPALFSEQPPLFPSKALHDLGRWAVASRGYGAVAVTIIVMSGIMISSLGSTKPAACIHCEMSPAVNDTASGFEER